MTAQLSAIYRYPLKSARGHALAEARMDRCGIDGDRRWMLVDAQGEFLSQRGEPRLALLGASADTAGGLQLSLAEASLSVARPAADAPRRTVRIWGDRLPAADAGDTAAAWLRERLGRDLRLVHLPQDAQRPVDPDHAPPGQCVNFADGFPLLVVTRAALAELNSRLERPVPMDRFRPNLVIDGAAAHAEDQWRRLRIGSAEVELVKPCARCAVPAIDQATARRDPQINRVLAGYRRREGQVMFGMNALAAEGVAFRVGDPVTVLR